MWVLLIEKETRGEQVRAAARRGVAAQELGVERGERLAACRGTAAAEAEYLPRSGARRLDRRPATAMQEAGVIEARHDREQRIEPRARLRGTEPPRRGERRQPDFGHMREAGHRLAAGTAHPELAAGTRAVA